MDWNEALRSRPGDVTDCVGWPQTASLKMDSASWFRVELMASALALLPTPRALIMAEITARKLLAAAPARLASVCTSCSRRLKRATSMLLAVLTTALSADTMVDAVLVSSEPASATVRLIAWLRLRRRLSCWLALRPPYWSGLLSACVDCRRSGAIHASEKR